MLTKTDVVKLEAPPAMRNRYILRCTDFKFGPNSNKDPMVTANFEIAGFPEADGTVSSTVKKGDKEYRIAGLKVNAERWTLKAGGAINYFIDFWEKANPGLDFPGIDPENPDIAFLDGLLMQAIVSGQSSIVTTELTEEEKLQKKAEGKPPVGEPILDSDGNKITRQNIKVEMWLKQYVGEVPEPF